MNTAILAAWVLSAMEAMAPSHRTPFRDIDETAAHRRERYVDTANLIAETVTSLPDSAFPFRTKKGVRAERHLAAWVVAVALHESGFLYSVDSGARVGDGGRAHCIMQINLAKGKTTPEGWTGKDLTSDRSKCLKSGIATLARHLSGCSGLPFADRTSGYASGSCQIGVPAAQRQARIARKILSLPAPPAASAAPPASPAPPAPPAPLAPPAPPVPAPAPPAAPAPPTIKDAARQAEFERAMARHAARDAQQADDFRSYPLRSRS